MDGEADSVGDVVGSDDTVGDGVLYIWLKFRAQVAYT